MKCELPSFLSKVISMMDHGTLEIEVLEFFLPLFVSKVMVEIQECLKLTSRT